MLKFNWRRRSDGAPMTKIQVTHTLTVPELEGLLIAAHAPTSYGDLHELAKTQVEALIRRQLQVSPDKRHWWTDDYREPHEGDPTIEDVSTWAKKQVAKVVPA